MLEQEIVRPEGLRALTAKGSDGYVLVPDLRRLDADEVAMVMPGDELLQVLNDVWTELGTVKSAHEYVAVAGQYLELLLVLRSGWTLA